MNAQLLVRQSVWKVGVRGLAAAISVLAFAHAMPAIAQVKTEVTSYHDNFAVWKLGQVSSISINGVTAQETQFDSLARPTLYKSFGVVVAGYTYAADGTVHTITDGAGNATIHTGWKRGTPQAIQYADGSRFAAEVDDNGWVTLIRDENGIPTCFQYDAMGRLARTTYKSIRKISPSVCGSEEWNPTVYDFQKVDVEEYGIPAGHWRLTTSTGNAREIQYFDAMWRPVLTKELDVTSSASEALTKRFQRFSYDQSGRTTFVSYPGATDALVTGKWTEYDALGRVTSFSRDSELSPSLQTTTTEYLSGFRTRVTNPRGHSSVTIYQTFDQPTYGSPVGIDHPEGASTEIYRDIFGKVTALRRRNADASTQVWRHYVYDGKQQLCKVVEPETGATIMDYDAGGKLQWTASGLHSLTNVGSCDTLAGRDSGRKVTRHYDARNRLRQLLFPNGVGDQLWTYTPDGLPAQVTTWNETGGQAAIVNDYVYNDRRLLVGESIHLPNWYVWGIGYGYDSNGSLSTQTYPTGLAISYGPNALGQATRASDQTGYSYAHNASYYPNGALKQFTYANGLVYSMTQNARQLPKDVQTSGGVQHDRYAYDANGNVESILDVQDGGHLAWAVRNRYLAYDGLDRLTAAGSGSFGGDHWHRFSYNVLDNITAWKLAGVKDHAYVYDSQNRLGNLKNPDGSTVVGFGYDVQGNLSNKNGRSYTFDYGNRLRETYDPNGAGSGPEWYRYDANGRRVHAWGQGLSLIASQYSRLGQLLYVEDYRAGKNYEHIYLAGSVIAIREWSHAAQSIATKFQHTDALGSPIAVTDQSGAVIDRNNYEPFGSVIGESDYQGFGYATHMQDASTDLTYMQQRYYDPQVGLFLSVDPVGAKLNTGRNFNRYGYANNNPYRFTDPYGKAPASTNLPTRTEATIIVRGVREVPFFTRLLGTLGWVSPTIGAGVSSPFLFFYSPHPCGGVRCGELPPMMVLSEASDGGEAGAEGEEPNEPDLDKVKTNKEADRVAQEYGYRDAHDAKDGRGNSTVDIYIDRTTGRAYLWNGARGAGKDPL